VRVDFSKFVVRGLVMVARATGADSLDRAGRSAYATIMKTVQRTAYFDRWLSRLRDDKAKQKIAARLDRLEAGNPGDHRHLGGRLSEMRIDYGPGYRIYWTERGDTVVLLLCGGDKTSQHDDIARAREMIKEL
jgi:putative addiction module killer protein